MDYAKGGVIQVPGAQDGDSIPAVLLGCSREGHAMPEPPAVIVLELDDGRDLEPTLQILGESARQVLATFSSRSAEVE